MSDHDAPMRPIDASDLLAAAPPGLNRSQPSPVSISSRGPGAVTPARPERAACNKCRDAGRLLVDEAEAQAAGWIPLERREFLGRWRVDMPCTCPAGLRVVADWQQLPPDAAGVTLESLFDHLLRQNLAKAEHDGNVGYAVKLRKWIAYRERIIADYEQEIPDGSS